MKKHLFKSIAVLVLLVLMVSMVGCSQETPPPEGEEGGQESESFDVALDFVVAPPDGDWYVMAANMWEIWNSNIDGLEVNILPGGGQGNVEAVGQSTAQMGMTSSPDAYDGYAGNAPFEGEYTNLRTLFTLVPETHVCGVFKDSDIMTFEDLKGKRVNVKPKGYSSHALNKTVLDACGITFDDFAKTEYVGDSEAIQLMQDGHLDAHMSGCGLPDATFTELSFQTPIRILPYSDELINKMHEMNPGLSEVTIPAGMYNGVDEDVPVIGYALTVVISEDVDEELVYQMTKSICENWDVMESSVSAFEGLLGEELCKDIGVPYHPGAERYFKEQGWM